MADVLFAAAREDEIREFASRRTSDPQAGREYLALAQGAANGAWVARDEHVAIGVAFARSGEDEVALCELYVEPGFRGRGIGSQLLERALGDTGDRARKALAPANDAAAHAFGIRHRLHARALLLRVAGAIPNEDDLLRLAASDYRFGVRPVDPETDAFALDALDREVRGAARGADHAAFAGEAASVAFSLENEFVGYAYVWQSGRIGPIASASAAYAAQFFVYALLTSARTYGASWCAATVPATNGRVLRAARRAGLRVGDALAWFGDAETGDLTRYVVGSDLRP